MGGGPLVLHEAFENVMVLDVPKVDERYFKVYFMKLFFKDKNFLSNQTGQNNCFCRPP